MMLCSLETVKAYLSITDTSKDELLKILIKQASAKIENFIGYSLERKEYNEELHNVNFMQTIQLNSQPIQEVKKVTVNGFEVTDFQLIENYSKIGMLYRGNGWNGPAYTRGLESDIVNGAYVIKVNYIAGYYLPDDEHYVEGASASLPYDIISACLETVSSSFNKRMEKAEGIKSHSEGGISTTFADVDGESGLSKSVCEMLVDYKRYGVA